MIKNKETVSDKAYIITGPTSGIGEKPSEIYLELGFEALPYFSFAFKKEFGLTPTELTEQKKISR